jgi:muconolactone delta-isomerase
VEFLVDFDITVPGDAPAAEVEHRESGEAAAAADLAARGHIARIWRVPGEPGTSRVLGLYRAGSRTELDDLLCGLPLYDWMRITVTPLAPHPNDPASADEHGLPDPRLTLVYRLEATLALPLDLGDNVHGRRRIVALTGGVFTGPDIRGVLLPGSSADWQVVLPDGTALGDIRYTLRTDAGDLLYVQSSSTRYGSPETLARLAGGEDVDPSEYVFRASTRIETAASDLAWLNRGVFVTVAGRQPAGVIYETYLVR